MTQERRDETDGEPAGATDDRSHPTSDRASDAQDGSDSGSGVDGAEIAVTVGRALLTFLQVLARLVFLGLTTGVALVRESDDGPVRTWVLIRGNRGAIVGTMTLSFFLGVLFLGATGVIGIAQADFVVEMFSTIIAGLFSFIGVVIAVNSLAMSGLSSSLGGIQDRVESVEEFRQEVAEMAPDTAVTPTDPAGFLDVVTDAMHTRANDLEAAVADVEEPARGDVEQVASVVHRYAEDIDRAIPNGSGVFDVLLPMMDDDYSRDVNRVRQLRHVYEDLPTAARERLTTVEDLLETLDVSRTYFKTIYLQQELAKSSRHIVYAGINALLWAMFIIMVFANGQPSTGGDVGLLLLVTLGMTFAFLPFVVLFAYVVRIASVIKRTSAPGGFTTRKEDREYA